MLIKCLMLTVFFAVMIGIGLYCRSHAADVKGFVLGGRSVGPWLTAFAYGTSYFSAVIFVGYAGQFGWKYGIASTWIGIGNALIGSMLAWIVLGRRTRIMSQYLDSATMPEFFGQRFQSRPLKIGASLIIFLFLIPYTASLYNGLSRLFSMAFSIDYTICIVLMAVFTGIYVIAGGYMATAINDFIQGIIMLIGIAAVIAAVLCSKGGFMNALQDLAAVEDASVSSSPGVFASFFGPDPLSLLSVILLTSLGTWGLPQMVQKFYAIRSETAIQTGMIVSTVFALIVAGGCYFLGGFGRLFSESIDVAVNGYDSIIPTMLSNLPDVLIALVIILVLSASMSTLSSLVIASSSTLTIDVIKDNIVADHEREKTADLYTFSDRCLYCCFRCDRDHSVQRKSVFHRTADGNQLGSACRFVFSPLPVRPVLEKNLARCLLDMFSLWKRCDVANMLFPQLFPPLLQSPINAGAFVMLAGFVIVPVVSLLTPKPDPIFIRHAFACYEKKVEAAQKLTLGGK